MRGATRRGAIGTLQILLAVLVGSLWFAAPAAAQKAPDAKSQEVLIKTSLLSFNDANVTGDYAVLNARVSKPFRDQFPPEKMKEVFKDFALKHINIAYVVAM